MFGVKKILNLLSVHRIISITGRKTLVALLQVNDLGGAVQVIVGEAREPSPNGT
jgi:hypothetical protein